MNILEYLLLVSPAIALGLAAQLILRVAYNQGQDMPTQASGFKAARTILDAARLSNVDVQQTPGQWTDHYEQRAKVLRLSADVYHGRSLTAIGVAAHETGHAIQDRQRNAQLVIRNAAVSAASFGSSGAIILFLLGAFLANSPLLIAGVVLFDAVAFLQLVNLPIEFDASRRVKTQLVELGIVDEGELAYVEKILNAAALTYVAATIQPIMMFGDLFLRLIGRHRSP